MINIYDIVLNFDKNIIEFYEWEEEDNIKYVKKIPLIKVNTNTLYDFLYNKIKIEDDILFKIENNLEFYDEDLLDYKYSFILSDGIKAIGYSYLTNEISTLLIDEEKEILKFSNKMDIINIDYKIIEKNYRKEIYLTRKELKIKTKLKKEITNLYKNNKIEQLNYYYYEYFNKISNNKEEVYNNLINTLENINNKHIYLYEISNMLNNK